MVRRIGVLASVAVTAAMFVGVTSAQADPSGTVACLFRGLSGQLDQPVPDGLDGILLKGTYDLSANGDCAGALGGTPIVPEGDADGNVTIRSSGHYDNLVCSSGWWWDISSSTAPTTTITANDDPTIQIADIDYEIFFVSRNGVLRVGAGPWIAPWARPNGNLGGHWVGGGMVHITPENQTLPDDFGCVNAPVAQFVVEGAFTATHR